MGHPQSVTLSVYFRLFKQTLQFLQKINLKKCPCIIRCWDSIRTHDLWKMSLHPLPVYQGSRPIIIIIVTFSDQFSGTGIHLWKMIISTYSISSAHFLWNKKERFWCMTSEDSWLRPAATLAFVSAFPAFPSCLCASTAVRQSFYSLTSPNEVTFLRHNF